MRPPRLPSPPPSWRLSSRWITSDVDLAGVRPMFAVVEREADGRQIILREFGNKADARTYCTALHWAGVAARLVVIIREIETQVEGLTRS